VTVAAGRLQDAGLIHYSRGHITVLNREGLEAMACECYQIVDDELNRLVGTQRSRCNSSLSLLKLSGRVI